MYYKCSLEENFYWLLMSKKSFGLMYKKVKKYEIHLRQKRLLIGFQQLIEFNGFRQTVEQLLAEDERRVVDGREDLGLVLPPDEDVVEGDAADDDDERHGDAQTLVRNCEREDEHQEEEGQEEDGDDERQPERQVEVLAGQPEVDLGKDGESRPDDAGVSGEQDEAVHGVGDDEQDGDEAAEEKRRNGTHVLGADEREHLGQVALPGSHKKESGIKISNIQEPIQ